MAGTPVDLFLNGNEGIGPPPDLLRSVLASGVETVRRYPDGVPLERQLAGMLGVSPSRVVVTAGADDALARILRAVLAPGREMVLPVPTFEMLDRYARLAGGEVVEVLWGAGPLPVDDILSATTERTSLIVVVSPNSPMGQAATPEDLTRLSEARPDALLLVDLAYVDFAEVDLTSHALSLSNAVITRTLSKAWGLAGLRVGYAAGPEAVIDWLRAAGQPYSVSSLSLAVAAERLATGTADVTRFIAAVQEERGALVRRLLDLGVDAFPSQGNFVFARFEDPIWVRDAMAGLGIAVRAFPGKRLIEDGMRITLPGNAADFERLVHGFESVLAPGALLFDIDDTLADVTDSYRKATVATAGSFGVTVTFEDITRAKAEGDANNDWELTWRMVTAAGKKVSLEAVTERFESFYQGTPDTPGYKTTETLLCDRALLERLAARIPLGVVTGRPVRDAREFLENQNIADLFGGLATMEDGPAKPDPAPVRAALTRLGVTCAWMVGDTPDDMRAARSAQVVPIGVAAPADDPGTAEAALIRSGAGRVIGHLNELEELLP
jgi:histidinol-phosphate aminotransferase